MILLVHMLFGAVIGSAIKSIPLAIILAFLSHYLLDLIPHIEYPLENAEKRHWRRAFSDALKVSLDFLIGILILSLTKNQPIIFVYAVLAAMPDALTVWNNYFPNKFTKIHAKLHTGKVHFLHNSKKISKFWRILTQVAVVVISITLLRA